MAEHIVPFVKSLSQFLSTLRKSNFLILGCNFTQSAKGPPGPNLTSPKGTREIDVALVVKECITEAINCLVLRAPSSENRVAQAEFVGPQIISIPTDKSSLWIPFSLKHVTDDWQTFHISFETSFIFITLVPFYTFCR